MQNGATSSRIWSSNANQLDKIDAIPSRWYSADPRDNILIEGLCLEDQIHLRQLIEASDSSDSDGDDSSMVLQNGPGWSSPMIHKPLVMNKRIKMLKTHYAITLSLEDISYIRPSWGLSKSIKRIDMNNKRKLASKSRKNTDPQINTKKNRKISHDNLEKVHDIEPKQVKVIDTKRKKGSDNESLVCYLILLSLVLMILMFPPIIIEKYRQEHKIHLTRIRLVQSERLAEFYRPPMRNVAQSSRGDPIFKLYYGQNIPANLKHESCDCQLFEPFDTTGGLECIACLDWASRANLRIFVERIDQNSTDDIDQQFCYHFKWQNYNTLMPPLVDCFDVEDIHWFGLGDILDGTSPFTRLEFNWKPLKSNLTSDLQIFSLPETYEQQEDKLVFGSYVNLTLISSNQVFLGNVRSDFELLAKLGRNQENGAKTMCLAATCTDMCSETWQRDDNLDYFRHKNNIFEYTVCSATSLKTLLSRKVVNFDRSSIIEASQTTRKNQNSNAVEVHSSSRNNMKNITSFSSSRTSPEDLGLIDRVLFATSIEFLPNFDSVSLRDHVNKIINLDIKSSLMLSIDTRWQTYEGSFKLDTKILPKAKLLIEILHNKGFKILFGFKPYIDGVVGLQTLNELFEMDRLYAKNFVDHKLLRKSEQRHWEELSNGITDDYEQIIRRNSFFSFRNQSVLIRSRNSVRSPHLFSCKESQLKICALIDLTKSENRKAIIASIKRSELLAFGVDGFRFGGVHSNFFAWQDHFRQGVSDLTKELFYKEKIIVLSRYSGDLGYIELAPRSFTWSGMRSCLTSVINLGMMGFSLVHPGSVWGDLRNQAQSNADHRAIESEKNDLKSTISLADDAQQAIDKSEEELANRWLQLFTFMPILQFNSLDQIQRFQLHDQLRLLAKLRKTHLISTMKRYIPLTPLVSEYVIANRSKIPEPVYNNNNYNHMPLIRPVSISMNVNNNDDRVKNIVVAEQFIIGESIIVAPILWEGQRQRDIYLPPGIWRDELRKVSLRGGKWLRNYPLELNEIAWFTSES